MTGRPAATIVACVAGCALACAAWVVPAAPGDRIRVDVSGQDRDTLRLGDAWTRAPIACDRVPGEPLRDSLVSPDDAVVAVRHGARDDGDSLAAYALAWTVDPATGARVGTVARVLSYRPRDGHLSLTLRQVPNGTVLEARTGRHPPLWTKVFFHDRARDTWYEWPRALAPHDPTAGVPTTVGATDTGDPYAAWLRRIDPHCD